MKKCHAKQFEVKGFIQDLSNMGMMPCKFVVTVSNDTHCTVSVAPHEKSDIPIQYCIDFTKIAKELSV
jgi:hypothetical protein